MKIVVTFNLKTKHEWIAQPHDWVEGDPSGHGFTREEALEDLVWQLTPGTVYEVDGVFYFHSACEEV